MIQIPGSKDLMIEHVLLDFNGTIGVGSGSNDEQMLREAILGGGNNTRKGPYYRTCLLTEPVTHKC